MAISITKLKNDIYKITSYLTSHKYSDDSWEGVNQVLDAIRYAIHVNGGGYELVTSVENGGYRVSNDGLNSWKEYKIEIFKDGSDKVSIGGTLCCFPAGTVEYPFGSYDMSLCIFAI